MFLVRTITGKTFRSLLVLALLLMPTAAWSRTGETLSRDPASVQWRADVAKIEMTIRDFFEALRRDDKGAFQRLTTRSFYSFDVGKRFAGDELLEMVREMHAQRVQLNWNIGAITIHLECNMAWAAWENSGSVGASTDLRPARWLESAVLVKKEGTWKIDFLHSTRAAQPEGNSNQ